MEYQFTAAAIVRMGQIINLWPAPNRGTMQELDSLAQKVELNESDHEAINWRPSPDSRTMTFQADVLLARELDASDVQMLSHMIEQPPERLAWTRGDRPLQAAIFEPLGIEPWL